MPVLLLTIFLPSRPKPPHLDYPLCSRSRPPPKKKHPKGPLTLRLVCFATISRSSSIAPWPPGCVPRSSPDPPGRLDAAARQWRCVPHRPCFSFRFRPSRRRLDPKRRCLRSLTTICPPQLPDVGLGLASPNPSRRLLVRKPSTPRTKPQAPSESPPRAMGTCC